MFGYEDELQYEISVIRKNISKIILDLECKNDDNQYKYLIEQLKNI